MNAAASESHPAPHPMRLPLAELAQLKMLAEVPTLQTFPESQ